MNLSPRGLHLIASFEGFVPVPYNDVGQNATIGYGHLIHMGPVTAADREQYGTWTVAKGLTVLDEDAQLAVAEVRHAVRVRLGIIPARAQARFDALCSLCFNIGGGAFAASHLVREINRKGAPRDWHPCGPLLLEWDHAGGAVVLGLLARRKVEAAQLISGQYA